MPEKGQAAKPNNWPPAISDEKVKAATGRNWMGWLVILNRANAQTMPHKEIAKLLGEKYDVPAWWRQMIAVEYEKARGGRRKNERPGGTFSVNVTKVMPASLADLFAAATNPKTRAKWFPPGTFEETSKTENKYWRGKWRTDGKLEFGFTAKGEGKAQIALESGKLENAEAVETERALWKKSLDKLSKMLESD
jgi:hypothetical protein